MLRPKLVLQLTEILQTLVLKKHDVFYTGSHVVRATIQHIITKFEVLELAKVTETKIMRRMRYIC